jgi:hypothetical protein
MCFLIRLKVLPGGLYVFNGLPNIPVPSGVLSGRTVRSQTVLSLTQPFNTGYRVKYPDFALILALCQAIKSTSPIRQLYASGYSAYRCMIGLVDLIARLCAMNLAK